MHHELSDVDASEACAQQPPQERERQRGQRQHLPPEEIDGEARRSSGEREDTVEHGTERGDDCSQQQRPQNPPRAWRGEHKLPPDEDDERRREHAVRGHGIGVLQEGDDVVVPADGDQALPRDRIEVTELLAPVVEQQDREGESDRDEIREPEEGPLEPVRHPPGRIGERHVRDERVPELTDEEEDREREVVVAVAELPREKREADGDHEGPEMVVRSTSPRDESGDEERPRSAYGRQRTCGVGERQVVDLNPVGEDAERDTRDPEARPGSSASSCAHRHTVARLSPRGVPGPRPRGQPREATRSLVCGGPGYVGPASSGGTPGRLVGNFPTRNGIKDRDFSDQISELFRGSEKHKFRASGAWKSSAEIAQRLAAR